MRWQAVPQPKDSILLADRPPSFPAFHSARYSPGTHPVIPRKHKSAVAVHHLSYPPVARPRLISRNHRSRHAKYSQGLAAERRGSGAGTAGSRSASPRRPLAGRQSGRTPPQSPRRLKGINKTAITLTRVILNGADSTTTRQGRYPFMPHPHPGLIPAPRAVHAYLPKRR